MGYYLLWTWGLGWSPAVSRSKAAGPASWRVLGVQPAAAGSTEAHRLQDGIPLSWPGSAYRPRPAFCGTTPPLPSPLLSKSTGALRDQRSLICLASTFLFHRHSLGTLCAHEGLE